MADRIQFRRDTGANWTSINPVLSAGELGLETDTGKFKIGNGTNTWTTLGYGTLNGTLTSLSLDAIADPSAPASGIIVYGKSIGGRVLPKFIGPSGLDSILQPSIFGNGMSIALPGTTTALSYVGMGAMTAVGTLSHPTLAVNSLRESTRRAICTSAGTANSASELRYATALLWRGNGAGLGGFFCTFRFGISSTVATQRIAVGLWAATAATSTSTEPSALVSGVWVGNDSADANLQLMYNDGSGTATKINLGANFVKNQQNGMYELNLSCKPNDTKIGYRVKRLDAAGDVEGELTTDLPTNTTFLAPHFYANNGGTATAVVLDFYRMYLESDY